MIIIKVQTLTQIKSAVGVVRSARLDVIRFAMGVG